MRRILDGLPDEASFEEIIYHIYVRQKVARGERDIEQGRTVTQDEAERHLEKWIR